MEKSFREVLMKQLVVIPGLPTTDPLFSYVT